MTNFTHASMGHWSVDQRWCIIGPVQWAMVILYVWCLWTMTRSSRHSSKEVEKLWRSKFHHIHHQDCPCPLASGKPKWRNTTRFMAWTTYFLDPDRWPLPSVTHMQVRRRHHGYRNCCQKWVYTVPRSSASIWTSVEKNAGNDNWSTAMRLVIFDQVVEQVSGTDILT